MARPDQVAIVGMAGLFPGAPTIEAFWANVRAGVDAITPVPEGRWDPVFYDADATGADRFYCRRGGFVDDLATFDPLAHAIMPNAVGAIEPDQLLALAAADAALADAGRPHERVDPTKVSVVLGRGGYLGDGVARLDQRVRTAQQLVEALRALVPEVGEDRLAQVRAEFQDRLGPVAPESSIGLVPNLAASRIANRFDLRGPAYTVDAACASSLLAVDQAVAQLRSGAVDVALAGGVHHCHDLTLWSVFCQLRALSPTEAIRPFSRDADGILVGEGTGVFVLKRVADAERDDDRIYAVIAGTGSASDGAGASLMNPRAEGQVLAVEQAWRASGLDPATVGLIEAHGTATPVGDRTEVETLRTVFGDEPDGRPVLGSVKSMIGHAMPAAGAAGLAKAVLAVHHGELPPTLHVDEPNEALAGSRFRMLGAVEPWEGDGPRVAGVNAFGFGGINAHVVVHDHPSGRRARRRRARAEAGDDDVEELILLAGPDAADLVEQLDRWAPGRPVAAPTGGPARLAVVAPDERRLKLAHKVLERATPFRGRNDVWFDPGTERGRVAFLYPGVEPVFEPRVDDVAERFSLRWDGLAEGVPALERQGRGLVAVGRLLTEALAALGIRPDVIAGHSLGEWTGQIVSGMIPERYVEDFLEGLQPGSIEVSDVVFVALGAGAEVAAELVEGIDDAYVSHDNCPHQSVICAPAASAAVAVERAREAKVLAQELPFRSGFHSPLFAPLVAPLAAEFGSIPLRAADVPLWSATSLAPYPDDPDAIGELSGRHLVEPVRFRQLTERLYDSGVRTFVQVGTGSLGGFVDDTLRDRPVTTVAANVATRPGVDQLRRVAAALWVAGVDVDFAPLGHEPAAAGSARPLVLGSTLVRDLTPLDVGPAEVAAWDDVDGPEPLLDEFRATVAEAESAALAVLRAARDAPARPATAAGPQRPRPRVREAVHTLSVDAQPHWLDHAFYEQPPGWPVIEDLFPLVPMTAIIEMLMTESEALVPGSVATEVTGVRAFRWLAVHPPTSVTVRATLDDDDATVRASVDGHARATVRVASRYPAAPAPSAAAVDGQIHCPVTPEQLYEQRHLFHGPAYQGLVRFDEFGTDGASGLLETKDFPGSLLDNAGQLFGFWLAQRVERDRLVLPTSIDRISFYGPHPEPGTQVRCVVNCTDLGDVAVRADLELTVDGKVWCTIEGWEDRRFQSDDRLFAVLRQPSDRTLAEPQPGGWMLVREGWPDSASRDVVMRRFLGRAERADYDARNPNVQRVWLLGRIAAKDAVRRLRWDRGAGPLFPVEVSVDNDDRGRPVVRDPGDGPVHVSIAHTDGYGVAIASADQPVGIDVEHIEHRPEAFARAALSDDERRRFDALADIDRPEVHERELTRWWAAKEAASKAAGTGMDGRPKDWEVAETDGDRLRIGDRWLGTALVGTSHVVAWTEIDDHGEPSD